MTPDNIALKAKASEIARVAAEVATATYPQPSAALSSAIVDAFVSLTPPMEEEPRMELITLFSTGRRGSSRKPGNIVLNWRKLIDIIPDVTIAAAGAPPAPAWLQFTIALYIWNKFWCGAKEEFSDAEANVLLALSRSRDQNKKIKEMDGYEKTNIVRREAKLSDLSIAEYSAAVTRLIRMRCIEMESGIIWLREWVRIAY
jgi:hypothetical protein